MTIEEFFDKLDIILEESYKIGTNNGYIDKIADLFDEYASENPEFFNRANN